MTCREGATDLGAYVLGALDPVDRRRMDEHVLDCPACAAELEELAALPPLLATVPLDDLRDAPVTPSPDLYDRVAAAAAAERPAPARGRRWLLVAAALLVVVGAGAGITSWVLGAGEVTRTVVAGPVHMSVTVTGQGDGTVHDVSVAGVPAHTNCTLVVVDRDGDRHPAGKWAATYEGKAWFKGWSDVDRSDVENVVLLGSQGQELVRVPL
jgi:predicted anti-sigma-YlaC factor YlaD